MVESNSNQCAIGLRPRVSIIIPTYNRAPLLKMTLESVQAQTLQDFEVIVVDSNSTDDTVNVVSAFTEKVHYVCIDHLGLPSVARNIGLQMARGEYIAFLDSDDQWLPMKLEKQIEIMSKNPHIGLICSNAYVLEKGQNEPSHLYLRVDQGKSGWVFRDLLRNNFIISSTALISRSILNHIGGFSESPLLHIGEDYDFWLRIAEFYEVYYIPEPLTIYRVHVNNVSRLCSRIQYWQSILQILQRVKQRMKYRKVRDIFTEQLLDNLIYTYNSQLINAYWDSTKYLSVIKQVLQATKQRPVDGLKLVIKCIRKGT